MSKVQEFRESDVEQLQFALKEAQEKLFRLRLQSVTERLEAPSEIIKTKRAIARLHTVLREREIAAEKKAGNRK